MAMKTNKNLIINGLFLILLFAYQSLLVYSFLKHTNNSNPADSDLVAENQTIESLF